MFRLRPFGEGRRRRRRKPQKSPAETILDSFLSENLEGMRDAIREGFCTDIIEENDRFIIEAELPGLSKDDIDLELEENILTITARHPRREEHEEENYIHRERRTGAYQRSFQIENVQEDEITAEFENGILKIDLPKEKEEEPGRRTIDIN